MAKKSQTSPEAKSLYGQDAGIALQLDGQTAHAQTVRLDGVGAGFLFNNTILASAKRTRAGKFDLYQWRLTNTGAAVSPVVSNFHVFSIELPCRGHHAPRLHGFKGGGDDSRFPPSRAWQPWSYFHPTEHFWNTDITAQSADGRSSNDDCPFFVLEDIDRSSGWIIALGWSGDWQLIMGRKGQVAQLHIGMQNLRAGLLPGESILQPELLVARYQGTPREAWSALRTCIRDRFQPLLEGKPLRPVTFWDNYYGDQGTFTEKSLLETIGHCAETDIDYVVIDGGWTGGGEDGKFHSLLPHIGSWRPDPKRFKQGFKPVVAAAKKHKRKLGLWFDIECAHPASLAVQEYPELFFGPCPYFFNRLLRLDTSSGLDWAVAAISKNVIAANAKWIRWDFNSNPRSAWHVHDTPDRLGVTECRYIENLYKAFDLLRERFPDLIIENCASGGRRIDLGLVRRSHCDWISDHSQSEAIIRSMIHGAGQIFPSHRLNTSFAHVYLEPGRPVDWKKPLPASAYLSHFGGNLSISDQLGSLGKAGRQQVRSYAALFRKISGCFEDEFYPFGKSSDLFEGPAGIAGIDRQSGAAAVILFGQRKGRTFEELPSELNDLMKSQPLVADEGSDQFVASALWSNAKV